MNDSLISIGGRVDHFILDGHDPVAVESWEQWSEWMTEHKYAPRRAGRADDCRVARTEIDGVRVSTVFLGIDHGYDTGEPILFETMVFGGELDQEQERYCTWDEAERGHEAMVRRVRDLSEQRTPQN